MRIKVGITIGDPSGIGPEVTVKALSSSSIDNSADFTIIGDKHAFTRAAGRSTLIERGNVDFIDLRNLNRKNFAFGKVSAEYGRASVEYINTAADLIKAGAIDCLVTAPVSKETINKAGYRFQGHTEYLAGLFGVKKFLMMLTAGPLRIGLVSRHIPLKQVAHKISRQDVIDTILFTHRALKQLFGIKSPAIFVCGLNPHASDAGLIGKEEITVIEPAVKAASKMAKGLKGPLPADSAVLLASRTKGSGLVAMYHDQALIPLKLIGENKGVNLTVGLPFVRTSPLHGTGFDIAGKNRADASSMIEAVKTAIKCARILKRG
ncbi:MAG: 4-hydroxythreonine-4-phosphate dehydrogenase PdxA [Candidatus Omnitrophica bacterium]|nr:4-hydroxythreonine-4-phosphate dehydrogenase PdxA [Candidatus Omnitrophota bacterium]